MAKAKTIATFTIELTRKDLGRLPGSTRPSRAMTTPKGGKGYDRKDGKKVTETEG